MRFGRTIRRIMSQIVRANPKFGPVLLGKYDIADGYYRLPLNTEQAIQLTCLLPQSNGEEQLVAIPLVLPMGWAESPPYFCAATETIVDIINSSVEEAGKQPPHRLEHYISVEGQQKPTTTMLPIPQHWQEHFYTAPLANTDVYIDDIIGIYQPLSMPAPHFIRHVFNNIDRVFRPLDPTEPTPRNEPISIKKLQKGDRNLATRKGILGWTIDTHQYTLELTERRLHRLQELLQDLPRSRKRISTKTWHKVLGELRSMAPALAGSRGLFGSLHKALSPNSNRIYLTADAHDFLDDFRWLAQNLNDRSTRLFEVVPAPPRIIGTTDASGIGLGGIFFVPTDQATPANPSYHSYVWRYRLPNDIRANLISASNLRGSITNSDLELAAAVVHPDVIATQCDVVETTIATLHDNTPAVFWQRKGSATTSGPAAYLLRLHALHTRQLRFLSTHEYIPGSRNAMADKASPSSLDRMPTQVRDDFLHDYRAVQETIQSGVVPSRANKAANTWKLWMDFCTTHNINPWFPTTSDPLPYLQIFGQRYREGKLTPGNHPVRAGTTADAIRMVGQTYKQLGSRDFRLDRFTGQLDFRLQRQQRSFEKQDPAPSRVKPIPLQLVQHVVTTAYEPGQACEAIKSTADMVCIAFFYLLRPGEYTYTKNNTPFRLQDVHLYIDQRHIQPLQASPSDLNTITAVALCFPNQKNGVKGETISHSRSEDTLVCPCMAIVRRVRHFLQHLQPPSTPLCKYFLNSTPNHVSSTDIRNTLRQSLLSIGPNTLGIQTNEIDGHSLRAGGATALLCAKVDPNSIQLLGRWKSDAMIRYLHIAANPHTRQYARQMVSNGQTSFNPGYNNPT